MNIVFSVILFVYILVTVYRKLFKRTIKWLPVTHTRYAYVLLHELSHLVTGLITLCGVEELVLKTDKEKQSSGYYRPKRSSPIRVLWIKVGDSLVSFAGPVLPPILLYYLLSWTLNNRLDYVAYSLIFGLILIVFYSKERWYFILFFSVIGFIFTFDTMPTEYILTYLAISFVIWSMIGMIDELFIIGGYNRKGSDIGLTTKALFFIDSPILSWILNKFIQIYYLTFLSLYTTLLLK